MRRLIKACCRLAGSRAVTPLVMAIFLCLYIGIAFVSEEALTTLTALTRTNMLLIILLAAIPVNLTIRLVMETACCIRRFGTVGNGAGGIPPGMFDETVHVTGSASLGTIQQRFAAAGYATRLSENSLSAWRGVSVFPARFLLLMGTTLLFCGIIASLTGRVTTRVPIVEGEPITVLPQGGGRVERISLREHSGLFLNRTLAVELATPDGIRKTFGLYPPSRYHGLYFYPRYLGIAPLVRFSAPDLPGGFATHYVLMIYPPGKEDSADIPGTAYRIFFSLAPSEPGNDPYMTGRMTLLFRVLKGKEPVATGRVPIGGEFSEGGYRLGFAGFRRVVATDFVQDHGVVPIWTALALFAAALLWWLPVRMFFPRREVLFLQGATGIHAASRAEGMRIRHGGIFHDALDCLEDDPATLA